MHTDTVDSIVQTVEGKVARIVRDRSPLLIRGCICGDDGSLRHNSTGVIGNRPGEVAGDARTLRDQWSGKRKDDCQLHQRSKDT
jgi:hypothetical protein